jgi:glyoxylase I family protein
MIIGIHHVAISTPDLERITRFYRDTLGFEAESEVQWEAGTELGDLCDTIIGLKNSSAKSIMLKKGSMIVEFFQYSAPEPKPLSPKQRVCDHGYTHICLEVKDIDKEFDRLKNAGMTFHARPPGDEGAGLRAIYGRDPDGNVVELMEIVSTSTE